MAGACEYDNQSLHCRDRVSSCNININIYIYVVQQDTQCGLNE